MKNKLHNSDKFRPWPFVYKQNKGGTPLVHVFIEMYRFDYFKKLF